MPFEIIWTKRAKKDLKLIDKPIARRILEKIEGLGRQEEIFLGKVKGKDFYKFRVGRYRAFIDKFPATHRLVIIHVRHRRSAYKNI